MRLPEVIHLDLSREVRENVDRVLFALIVLGQLRRRDGLVWIRRPNDLYLVENTPLYQLVQQIRKFGQF